MLRKTKKRFSVHKNLNYYVFVTENKIKLLLFMKNVLY